MNQPTCPGGRATRVAGGRGFCPSCGKDWLAVTNAGDVHAHAPARTPHPPPADSELERQIKKHHDLYRYASQPPALCPECGAPL